jgi:hypothetical protein
MACSDCISDWKKKFTHFHQQIKAVYRDEQVDMSPIQFWKVQVSETILTHASLNDKHFSRQLQISANQSHQNTADKISMSWNTHHPDHTLFHIISIYPSSACTQPSCRMSAWTLLLSVSFNTDSKIIHVIRYNYLTLILQHPDFYCSLHIMNYEINFISLQIKKTMTKTTHILKDWEELMFSGRLCLVGCDILQYDKNQCLKPLIMEETSKLYAKDLTDKGTWWARIQLSPKQQQGQKNYKLLELHTEFGERVKEIHYWEYTQIWNIQI